MVTATLLAAILVAASLLIATSTRGNETPRHTTASLRPFAKDEAGLGASGADRTMDAARRAPFKIK